MRVLEGNPGKRPLNHREPNPKPKIPSCPAHLGTRAKQEWRRMSRQLYKLGLLTEIDRAAFAGYCTWWGRWVEAEEKIREHGTVVRSPQGYPMQSPYLAIANHALTQMTRLLAEFGMSPASRARVHADPPPTGKTVQGFFGPREA